MTVLCEVVRTVKLSKKRYYKVAVIHFNYNPVFFSIYPRYKHVLHIFMYVKNVFK